MSESQRSKVQRFKAKLHWRRYPRIALCDNDIAESWKKSIGKDAVCDGICQAWIHRCYAGCNYVSSKSRKFRRTILLSPVQTKEKRKRDAISKMYSYYPIFRNRQDQATAVSTATSYNPSGKPMA
jgi:hypothetical protein